jgi:oligopeptide transport system substrate-binding protein
MASSWTVDSTGTIYTFQLRSNGRWSDGSQLVAADFVAGLKRAVDPQTASGSAALLTPVKGASEIIAGRKNLSELGVVALGNSTVEIRLEHSAPFILEILAQPIAAPFRALTASPASSITSSNRQALTDGAYTLFAHVPGSYIELERNPRYWDSEHVAIERIRYLNSESEATELREYLAGQLDLTFTIPTADLTRISKDYPAEIQNKPFLATLYLALNLTAAPMKNNRELRQALSMAVDREIIASRIMMGVTPAYSFVAKGAAGYSPPEYGWSKWSREQQLADARNHYQAAGYAVGNPLHLRLYFNQDEGIRRLMIAIAGSWKQNLGVETELISDEFRVFLVDRKDRSRWDIARLGWTADYDDPSSFLEIFAKNSTQNDPGYLNAAFDDLLERAAIEPINQIRFDLLKNAEQLLLDDYPIIPIYFYQARRLVKPYVGGAELTPMNRTYSKHLFWKQNQ